MKRINEITLDWDISYSTIKNSRIYNEFKEWVKQNKDMILKIEARKSSHGNTHIRITLNKKISEFQVFQIRAYLHDDVYRLALDLIRSYENKPNNRLWDEKFDAKTKEILRAGKWEDITEEVLKW